MLASLSKKQLFAFAILGFGRAEHLWTSAEGIIINSKLLAINGKLLSLGSC